MQTEFERVAIVNRGEPAMRFIHAVREFNQERGTSLHTIALFTDPDRDAMFVREADETVSLGPAHFTDERTGQAKSTYVDYDRLERALRAASAEAVWVGWGFVAEHAEFADLCCDLGIVFIGPDGAAMRRLGDKITSKRLAEEAQIPVAPWSGGPVETLAEARYHAERLGYPLFIKATAGGGGHGIRRVHFSSELANAFERARAEAGKAFGNATVFLEQLVEHARHVEVQIIADHYGTTWAAGVRDCTVQRRHQKILEEAPSPALSEEQHWELREAAVRLSQSANYHNAGTVEFLYQPEHQRFSFLEMNTRLQVEHPVTECTTGIDLVKLQIHVARGGRLEGAQPHTRGHAIEVRLNAEDADNGFAPAPGVIKRLRIPTGPGVRIDTGVAEGDVVPPDFDSMIAKIIAYGQTRQEAISRLQRALRDSVVVIQGGSSNKAFLLDLLSHDDVHRGAVDVAWLDRLAASGNHVSRRYADVALIQAAIEVYATEAAAEEAHFYASAAHGRPQVRNAMGHTVELRYRGNAYSLKVSQLGPKQYGVETDGQRMEVRLDRLGPFEYRLTGFGRRFHVVSVVQGLTYRIDVDGVSHLVGRDDGGVVHAPAPAIVVSIAVAPGDTVSAGQPVAVLEAMKMEMQVVAPCAGRVRSVTAKPYVQVDAGAPLLQIEPAAGGDSNRGAERVVFGASRGAEDGQAAATPTRHRILYELRRLMLGFDLEPGYTARLLAEWHRLAEASSDDLETRRAEDEILNIFADICSLFERQPAMAGPTGSTAPSPESHLFAYLRAVETRGEGLPPEFVASLQRALAHYGVDSLEPSPELEESLLWIYKSHQRLEQQVAPILRVLERRLAGVEAAGVPIDDALRTLLDRIISATRERFPAVCDLAREMRYRLFERPLFERACRRAYDEVEQHLAYLDGHPEAPDRDRRVQALLDCPQLLARLFIGRFAAASPHLRQLMLEVLTRRYYKIQTLRNLETMAGSHCGLSGEYESNGQRIHLLTTYADFPQITEAARAMFPSILQVPPEREIAIDFYVSRSDDSSDAEAIEQEVCAVLNEVGFPRAIGRVVVAVAGDGNIQHFTYRHDRSFYEEDKLFRGIHPMMADRLHLWRLANFDIDRLPSVEDVYVLHAVARENPKDERLFAVAEVRDLTPVRDAEGCVTELPHLERMFTEAAAGIRLAQARRPARERLYWNRILLYVWPPLDLQPEEIRRIALKLVPATEGLGLEQVIVHARMRDPKTGELREMVMRLSGPSTAGLQITIRPATRLQPLRPLTPYTQKVVRMRQRGLTYPYEIIRMLTPALEDTRAEFPPGDFSEYDLADDGRLIPVDRPYGQNAANIIAGVITNFTAKYPEGIERVLLLGDPSKDLGAIAEPECRRILAALDLAQEKNVPLEWFPISAGAKISMDSGVENMDWIARVLRRLVEFTQAGGEVNLVIDGINVGAQPYWNAEATMLMHTRGILIMTQKAAMVLTGKRALDYSGSVSAEDNLGIGGYDRIMGVNGQAQYWARDIDEACHILLRHYDHTYLARGERFPRKAVTADPLDRDVRIYPHSDGGDGAFGSVGEIFSDETNPGRKKSFDIRRVMLAVVDQDHAPLERWGSMRSAETAVVWDAHLGGYPVCFIGIESRPLTRLGFVPADGPDQWTAGTLFPLSSKKVARAINAASNNRPVVLLANLSGFDGSPESMRKLQLEYGAEIGRAVVNFKGPIVFCVISRYHGGAYVVFSRALSEFLEVLALEGTYASVIGGAPAAAVVFASEVEARARKDPRLEALNRAMAEADGVEKSRIRTQWNELFPIVHSEKLGEMADEFDRVHSVHRALRVGALHDIIAPAKLRPYLIEAVERGLHRVAESESAPELVAAVSV